MRYLYLLVISLILSNSICSANNLKIAVVAPFTGSYANYGTVLLSGAMQAANDINQSKLLNGVTLEVIPVDDKCNPDIAVSAANNLVRDEDIIAVIGHACSDCTLATSKIYNRSNMLVISPSSTNPKVTQSQYSNLFKMLGNDEQQSLVVSKFITQKLKSKKVAILHDNRLYSKELADLVGEHLMQLGATPIMYQSLSNKPRSMISIATKIKELDADCVYFPGLYPEVARLTQTLDGQNLAIPVIAGDAIATAKFTSMFDNPKLASSVLFSFATSPKELISSQKVISHMKKNNLETSGYSLYAYAAMESIAQAISGTNSNDRGQLANWLHQNQVKTVLGKKSWDSNGEISDSDFKMYSWDNAAMPELISIK